MSVNNLTGFKAWLTPVIGSVLWFFIWRDLSELRSDVKILLENKTESSGEIKILKEDMQRVKDRLWYNPSSQTPVSQTAFINTPDNARQKGPMYPKCRKGYAAFIHKEDED
jgi:hypothetical protein